MNIRPHAATNLLREVSSRKEALEACLLYDQAWVQDLRLEVEALREVHVRLKLAEALGLGDDERLHEEIHDAMDRQNLALVRARSSCWN